MGENKMNYNEPKNAVRILLAASPRRQSEYHACISSSLDQLNIPHIMAADIDPKAVDYIVYSPNSDLNDFSPYIHCKAVFNLWAGVEEVINNPTLKVPLCRMVDPGLRQGMVEWVTGHVLRYHLGMDRHINNVDAQWFNDAAPPLAHERLIAILGFGQLGAACAQALKYLGFSVRGWSQRPKVCEGIETFHGEAQFTAVLDGADIAVLLLPNTEKTQDIFSQKAIAAMKQGGVLLNPGRGPLIDDRAVIEALDSGQLSHATLDVFRQEPLPQAHPYWSHPKVTVTPHIAAETRPETSAPVVAENIRRALAGEPLLHVVDRQLGY